MKIRRLYIIVICTMIFLSFTACGSSSVSLGQYKGIEVEVTEVSVTDEDVGEAILT